jgi:PAS domain S-box-containing protein
VADPLDNVPFQQLVEDALDIITVLSPEGTILFETPSVTTVLGHALDDLIGVSVIPLLHPDDAVRVAAEIEAALASRDGVRRVEFRMRHVDGSYRRLQAVGRRWMHEGEPYVLVNSRDITAQHEAQAGLARSNELLSKVFTVSSNLLSITTPENGTFLDVNNAWLDTLGYRREEVIGRTALELGIWGAPENRARVLGELSRAGELRSFRASAFTRDGVERHLLIDARFLEVAAQTRVLLSCQDITDILLIEEELRQSQKLEALGQLTGGVAHDFNNILAIISGHAELLQRIRPEDSSLEGHVDHILKATQLGARLTRHLLAFSRSQPLSADAVDVTARIEGMRELIQTTVSEAVSVTMELPAEPWSCRLDPVQLENALLNLALNARDAMPAGGSLTLRVEHRVLAVDRDAHLLADAPAGEYLCIRVSDTGAGMSADVQARALEPFFTTKDMGKGTGLGLSMVFGFVRQSKGLVAIDSETGRGTSVSLYFPRVRAAEMQTGEAADVVAETPAVLGAGRALIIEDNEPLRDVIEQLLVDLGYRVSVACGEADIDALPESARFDLIVSDVLLKGAKRGPQLVRELCARQPECGVIFMTGYADAELPETGAVCLRKPFDRKRLHRAIASLQPPAGAPGVTPAER